MIIENILNIAWLFIGKLPDVTLGTLTVELANALAVLKPAFEVVFYFIPAETFAKIMGIQLAFYALRMAIAIVKSAWAIIPFA